MKKNEIMNNVTRSFHKFGFKVKKHSPEILIVAGVVGGVTSAVMACKATTKLSGILEEAKEKIDTIHEVIENPEKLPSDATNTEEDSKKDLTIVYAQTGLEVAKLYGPSVLVGALSITAILSGHNILRKRNVALAAAYTAVDTGFKECRGRVIERFGKELDRELKYNIKAQEVEEKVVNEDGTETTVKKVVEVVDDDNPSNFSVFARFYDDGCTGWTKDPEYNLMFLKAQENYANDKLDARGWLYLNEVYDMLGLPLTAAGQEIGWIYDKTKAANDQDGDGFVDFGIFDTHKRGCRDFVNGYERVILLDFNVDGVIKHRMEEIIDLNSHMSGNV